MKDNRGFSLVELIVVVLIMGILATGAVMSMSVVYNANSKRVITRLIGVLDKARTEAMAQNDEGIMIGSEKRDLVRIAAWIELEADGYYHAKVIKQTKANASDSSWNNSVLDDVKLCNDSFNYKPEIYAGEMNTDLDTLNGAHFSAIKLATRFEYYFKKNTGAIEALYLNGNADNCIFSGDAGTDRYNFYDLIVSGSETTRIMFSAASGRCYLVE